MPAEAVEDPAVPRRHVHGLAAASELDLRIGDDWDVDPQVRAPMIVDVDMLRDFRARAKTHQPAPSPDAAKLRHHLADEGAAGEMLRWAHRSFEGIGRLAQDSDQSHRLVARKTGRVRDPGGGGKRA